MTNRLPKMVEAAWLYYEDGLTQAEIAERLLVSRATIGRLLEDARQNGVITIQFSSDRLPSLSLSQEVQDAFGLADALVIPDVDGSLEPKQLNQRLAKGGAQYLAAHMPSQGELAIGWGDTVSRTLQELRPLFSTELNLVTMTGGANAYIDAILGGDVDDTSQPRKIRANVVPAPIIASGANLASELGREQEVQLILAKCLEAAYALVGVGAPTVGSTLMEMGYTKADELTEIVDAGAVGDVLGQFFDQHGEVLDLPIHRRRIGIDIRDLQGRKNVIGVAGGETKVEAILAALYGRYIDILITDERTAQAMLQRHQAKVA